MFFFYFKVLDAMWDGFDFKTNVTGSAMTQDHGEKQR